MSEVDTAAVAVPLPKTAGSSLTIHAFLGAAVAFMFAVGLIGCAFAQVHITALRTMALIDLIEGGMLFLPVAYAHKSGHKRIRDAICFLFWAKFISEAIGPCVLFAARLRLPLLDAHLASIDRVFGVNIGAVHAWSDAHKAAAAAINFTYPRLTVYLIVAIVLPVAFGCNRKVREFFIANVLGLLLMLPLFALVPAIGPWTVYHFAPSIWQAECQKEFLRLRASGPVWTSGFAGIVAFPSLHVFWAIVGADALYSIRWLRVPAIIFSTLIAASTMTMGWHYFSDVFAGLILAVICIGAARKLVKRYIPY